MAGRIEIDFREIRAHEGDKRKGFEELICQLARREKVRGGQEFRRVEGSGGDAGTEAGSLRTDLNTAIRLSISLHPRISIGHN